MEEIHSDSLGNNTPPELSALANEVTMNLLPNKSKLKYKKQYTLFKSWCVSKNVSKVTENLLTVYC